MGRVLSPQEVATKKICTLETFQAVVASLKRRLVASPDVIGAAFMGTAVSGFTIRSDVDVIVLIRRKNYARAMLTLQRAYLYAAKRSVPVDFIVVDDELARTSLHTIDLLFHAEAERCIERYTQGIVKKNPLPYILPIGDNPKTIIRDYLRAKIRKLEKLWVQVPPLSVKPKLIVRNRKGEGRALLRKGWHVRLSLGEYDALSHLEVDRYALFQKTLEAPVHVARKMLEFWDVELAERSKMRVEMAYRECAPAHLGAFLKRLMDFDEIYTTRLDYYAVDLFDERAYLKLLQRIEREVPAVIEFCRENAFLIERD